jgi:hypothetical protein
LCDCLDEYDIIELITTYREGASAAFLAAAHGVGLCPAPPAHRWCPPDATHSSIYERQCRVRRIRSR